MAMPERRRARAARALGNCREWGKNGGAPAPDRDEGAIFSGPSEHLSGAGCQLACKPGSVIRRHADAPPDRRPFILGARCRTPHATNPDGSLETGLGHEAPRHPYSVLLPVGFAVTAPVARRAVRSYRTLSPLPLTPASGEPDGR